MVQNEYEYIEHLIGNGLQDNSAYSYGRYLNAVANHLDVVIGFSTVKTNEDVTSILDRLSDTDLARNYKNNCGTALRAYLRFATEVNPTYFSPDEIIDPDKYSEGAKKRITVNSYERNNEARNKCIEIYGLNCAVCNTNFEDVYGNIGIGFIHVHHTKPLSEINNNGAVPDN
jgi:5-methylcytosine-specific restriction protein A